MRRGGNGASSDDTVYFVERIVDHRIRRNQDEFLVKWSEFPESDNSWEPGGGLPAVSIRIYKERTQSVDGRDDERKRRGAEEEQEGGLSKSDDVLLPPSPQAGAFSPDGRSSPQ